MPLEFSDDLFSRKGAKWIVISCEVLRYTPMHVEVEDNMLKRPLRAAFTEALAFLVSFECRSSYATATTGIRV